ncbi:MAG: M48 family metallopeptidase [Desulfobulbaceae bacterium]|nr:M48 family metallopeptidase [Desulfobulbaceae bacterium]
MTYQAHAFHDKFQKGRISGVLEVTNQGLIFTCEREKVIIPIDNLSLVLGGASNRLILISHPGLPDYSFSTSDRSLLNNPLLSSRHDVRSQIGAIRHHRFLHTGVTITAFALLVLLLASPFFFMDSLARIIAARLPADIEVQIGEKSFAQYGFKHDILESEEGKTALSSLTSVLTDQLAGEPYPFHFYVVSDPNINAFALPGGYVVINTGLILAADNAEEVLGVVAHEISHVCEQHGIRHLISSAGIFLVVQTVLGDVSGLAAVLADAAPMLINQEYSREFENEADEKGYQLLRASKIDPHGLITFFEKLILEEKKILEKLGNEQAVKLITNTFSFLSTHPATGERINHLKTLMSGEPRSDYRDLSDEFAKLKKSVSEFVTQ